MAGAIRNSTLPANDSRDLRTVVAIIDEQMSRGQCQLTGLGKRLLESRRRIEQSGMKLLNRRELDRERAERRGGIARR
jgi:hypothetical protein